MRKKLQSQMQAKQQEFVYQSLNIISQYNAGDTTLNQMRVAQYISWQSDYLGHAATHQEICGALDIPAPTVTRAIAKFITLGWMTEEVDPGDGRKRITTINPDTEFHGKLDRKLRNLANKLLK